MAGYGGIEGRCCRCERLEAEVTRLRALLEAFPPWGSLEFDFSPGNPDWFEWRAAVQAWDKDKRQDALGLEE